MTAYTQAQAQYLINTICTVDGWADDTYLYSRVVDLKKITDIHPVNMTRDQLLAEIASGRWTEDRVYGDAWKPRHTWRVATLGEYYLYLQAGGQPLGNPSDTSGHFDRLQIPPMNTATAYTTYRNYVARIVNSRIRDRDSAADVVQSTWLAICQATIPDDLDEAKRLIRMIAVRTAIRHAQNVVGQTGKRAKVNSGIVTGDTADFIVDQSTSNDWLTAYPETLRYLAAHLASGGSARELYDSHGRYRVTQDYASLKEFCADFCVQKRSL